MCIALIRAFRNTLKKELQNKNYMIIHGLERIKTKEFQRADAKAIFGGIEKALEEMD